MNTGVIVFNRQVTVGIGKHLGNPTSVTIFHFYWRNFYLITIIYRIPLTLTAEHQKLNSSSYNVVAEHGMTLLLFC